jgi:hypothetical protein
MRNFPSRFGVSVYQATTDKGSLSLNNLFLELSEGEKCGAKFRKWVVLERKS